MLRGNPFWLSSIKELINLPMCLLWILLCLCIRVSGFFLAVCVYFGYSCVCAHGFLYFTVVTIFFWVVNKLNHTSPECSTFTKIFAVFRQWKYQERNLGDLIFITSWFVLQPLFRNSSIVVFCNRLIFVCL